jgi:hypothetical protein
MVQSSDAISGESPRGVSAKVYKPLKIPSIQLLLSQSLLPFLLNLKLYEDAPLESFFGGRTHTYMSILYIHLPTLCHSNFGSSCCQMGCLLMCCHCCMRDVNVDISQHCKAFNSSISVIHGQPATCRPSTESDILTVIVRICLRHASNGRHFIRRSQSLNISEMKILLL